LKYLRPKKKGAKIKIAPSKEITVMMYDVVRVEEKLDILGNITDGFVTILSMTGRGMIYQGDKAEMWTKKKYLLAILANKRAFKITDDFKFIDLKI
jgi:hypothetical protein